LLILRYSDDELRHDFGGAKGKISRKLQPLMNESPQVFFVHPAIGVVDYFGKWSPEKQKLRMSRKQLDSKRLRVTDNDGCLQVCGFANEKWLS